MADGYNMNHCALGLKALTELEIKAETARVKAEILNKYKAEESAEAKRRAEYLRMAQAISKLRY